MDLSSINNILQAMMNGIIVVTTFLWFSVSLHYRSYRNIYFKKYLPYALISSVLWTGAFTFILMNQHLFPQADSILHEAYSLEVKEHIGRGDFEELTYFLRPGNRFFRFLAGCFLYLTQASSWTVRFLGLMSGLAGVVCLLDVILRVNKCNKIPYLMALFILCLPSFVFWSTDFIKDGFTLGCNCYISQLLLKRTLQGDTQPVSTVSSWMALAVLTALRPHHAIAWYIGLSLGPSISSGKFFKAFCFSILGSICLFMLYLAAPEVVETIIYDGASETLSSEYESRSDIGGSAIGGTPIPFLTGFYLLLFRPFPGEVPGIPGLLSSLETMCFGGLTVFSMFRIRSFYRLFRSQEMMGALFTLIAYSFLLTYTYNLGLLVRIRISVLPCLFVLIIPICLGGFFSDDTDQ